MAKKDEAHKLKRNRSTILIIIILVVVSILFMGCFSGPGTMIKFAEPDDLKLTISSEEEIINNTENKSLVVNIELTNVVDDNLFVLNDFSINGLLEFKITTPSNNTIFPRHPEVDLSSKIEDTDYITLYKSESINTTVDIFEYEYSVGQNGEDSKLYDWKETGEYEIQFEYDNFQRGEIIESNIIEFWLKD